MIFSGGKTCRKLRALLPNMNAQTPASLSAGASSREWHLYNSVRLDRRWGPLGVVPIKLAVFLPAAVLDLGGLLSNKTGTTPMEASVAACAMSVLVAIMASFIFFPNAASHYLRRSARGGGYVSWMVHPRVGEVTLWACILATEIGFSRLASQAVTGTSGVQTRLGSSLIELGGQETSPADSTREFTTMGSTSTLPALLFPLLNWVAVGFLSPLMSCELYCVGVGVDPADSLVGGFGCSAWIHALSRIGTATWLCVGLTRGDSLLSPADAGVIRSLAWMSVVKTCVASFMAHASWCRRRAQYTDSSTMRGFLGYLSHECRVPLQVVLAGLEVLSGADGGSSLDGGSMEDCDSDTGTTNGTTGGPLTRSRSKGRLHEPSLNSCRRVQDALGGPDGYATHVRAMQMAARSIHDVLNDTLDLHKYVLTGKISMTPRRFDFLRAAFETVEEARVSEEIGDATPDGYGVHAPPAVDLRFEASPEAEAELQWVREELHAREVGDEQRLRQVLMNLVANGVRHTPRGGHVRVTVASAKAVRIEDAGSGGGSGRGSRRNSNDSARSEDGSPATAGSKGWRSKAKAKTFDDDGESQRHVGLITLSVHVTDTGAGILARDKRYIFTPYGRGEGGGGGSTTGGDGGIGLALSQLIAGQHGGKIDISSESGVGSTFSMEITLPLMLDPGLEAAARGHGHGHGHPRPHRHRTRFSKHNTSPSGGPVEGYVVVNNSNSQSHLQSTMPTHPRQTQPMQAVFASGLYAGADTRDQRALEQDIALERSRCRDGSDRAPRINMRRPSWEGERTPRPSKTSPTSSDEMAHQMATPTIHEGIAQAMSLGGIARPMQVDRPKRVLLVDDDRLVRMVLAALLRRMDATCVTACDGAEAVEMARVGSFDLVIMDLRMPVMDGLEATRRIREIDEDVPIVGLTANTMPEDTARFMRSGANEVIYKPISADNVEKLLRRYSDCSSNSPTDSYDDLRHGGRHHPGVFDTM